MFFPFGYMTTNSLGVVTRFYGLPIPALDRNLIDMSGSGPIELFWPAFAINAVFWYVIACIIVSVYTRLGGKPVITKSP